MRGRTEGKRKVLAAPARKKLTCRTTRALVASVGCAIEVMVMGGSGVVGYEQKYLTDSQKKRF